MALSQAAAQLPAAAAAQTLVTVGSLAAVVVGRSVVQTPVMAVMGPRSLNSSRGKTMPNFEILDAPDGNVINRINASAGFMAANHEHYRLADDQPAPAPVTRVITLRAFYDRFTQPERLAIRTAAKTDVVVEDFMKYAEAGPTVDMDSDKTAAGLAYLETEELISAGRADEIRTVPVTAEEAP